MSSSATGVGMPICFLGAILLILTQKSSQKFGDVLGIGKNEKIYLVRYLMKQEDSLQAVRLMVPLLTQRELDLRMHYNYI